MAKLILEHPNSGIIKKAPVGYSATSLFFPSLPALFRGDVKGFVIQFILAGFIIPVFIFAATYNKTYIQRLLMQGYKVKGAEGGALDAMGMKLGINLPRLPEAA